ncbi:serine hydrolase [Desulfobulbus alkaliphilus]|uniref:serine hydrolase n=1 Tax=Desulfobulbus alkaliphilus TaxID=869814 RepID=UPI00196513D9|nr:serine hydrolase [Desulfobulbus alkaliphilus]MBM9538047.1 serine hydrolase [Desulfobulbus alkaliphilus]
MFRIICVLVMLVHCPGSLLARDSGYDLVYLWDRNLETILDYQQELEEILGPEVGNRLRIVGREGREYGVVYHLDGSALESAQLAVQHNEALRKAGLAECYVTATRGYFRLYNVSYGQGPNLDALKKVYGEVYQFLGQEVGKDLFIEETGSERYTLIYRRRGDRESTLSVARKHGSLLQRKKIQTSIARENNNPVVFGEASFLDDGSDSELPSVEVASNPPPEAKVAKISPQAQPRQAVVRLSPDVVKRAPDNVRRTAVSTRSTNRRLEQQIDAFIKDLRRKGVISSDEATGWMVYDLTRDESVVQINGDRFFQAASMIKPFVALAFFHQVQEGSLRYGPQSRANMEAMIQRSNNPATNWVMKAAGGPARVDGILRNQYGHIFKNTSIVEYIPPGGRTYKNKALPSDYIRFLRAIWNDEVPYSKEIRRLMSLPARSRLYTNTPIPQGTLVYNKTGTTAHLCGDMGILVLRDSNGRRYPYAVVGIIERSSRPADYGSWMLSRGNVIRQVSTLVYEEMKGEYRLQ